MDVATTKIMSIHLEALLPPTSTELDVPPMLQVAAVLGVGLLYQGSVHRHIAEVLLGEIGRPPGPEMEHCIDRESYALASGLALGLVTLGVGIFGLYLCLSSSPSFVARCQLFRDKKNYVVKLVLNSLVISFVGI